MNIPRLVLPATIAAVLHAGLLYNYTDAIAPFRVRPPVLVDELKKPEIPVDVIEIPLATPQEEAPVVTPLAGGEPRPELPDIINNTGPKEFTVPIENPPISKIDTGKIGPTGISGEFGPGQWTQGHPKVVSFANLDKTPRAKVQIPPDYPPAMRQDKRDGVVMVEFEVDAKGRVVSARVRESSHRAFEEPTIRAVLQWRFEPGLCHGIPVSFRMVIPVNFKLSET